MQYPNPSIIDFIQAPTFPCVMAKAVVSKGFVSQHSILGYHPVESATQARALLYTFVDRFRSYPETLSTFSVSFTDAKLKNFKAFEEFFWQFLMELDHQDKMEYGHDPRVKNNPQSDKFSFSIRGEAFFMLVLHPESPRLARRYIEPTIIFNAHQQFDDLRKKGVFHKIRDLIRKRDKDLQGYINPMVTDHGTRSEVFQYMGRMYTQESKCPFHRLQKWFKS